MSAIPVLVFTDGACIGNPGPGGWGVVFVRESMKSELSGSAPSTTNNAMELTAAIEALRVLRGCTGTIHIYTDSRYVLDGILRWIKEWRRNGWRTAAGKPVKNAGLWRELDKLASSLNVQWFWLRGHNGHPENERADALANEAARKQN